MRGLQLAVEDARLAPGLDVGAVAPEVMHVGVAVAVTDEQVTALGMLRAKRQQMSRGAKVAEGKEGRGLRRRCRWAG